MKNRYGGLNRNTLRVARWKHDIDYAGNLQTEEKLWLAKFMDEYYNSTFTKDAPHLHNTQELKKSCYDAHNAAQRDLANHSSIELEPYDQRKANKYSPDDYNNCQHYSKDESLLNLLAEKIDKFNQAFKSNKSKHKKGNNMTQDQKNELFAIKAIVETALKLFDQGVFPGSTAAALQQTRLWLANMLGQLEAQNEEDKSE